MASDPGSNVLQGFEALLAYLKQSRGFDITGYKRSSPKQVGDIPPELLARYFDATDSGYSFRGDLRGSVIFERNDLTQDPPVSRLDLLTCRNILMYFNAETQARVMAGLYLALNDGGTLMLGRSETLFTQANRFLPVSLKHRIFNRATRVDQRDPVLTLAQQLPALPEDSEASTVKA